MGTFNNIRSTAKLLVFVFLVLSVVESKKNNRPGGGHRHNPNPRHQPPRRTSPPSLPASHKSPASKPIRVLRVKDSSSSGSNSGTSGTYNPASHSPTASKPIRVLRVKGSSSSGSNSGTSGTHKAPTGPPNYGFTSAATHGSGISHETSGNTGSHGANPPPIGFKPSVTQGSSHGSNPPSYGFKPSAPQEHAVNSKPLGTANTGTGQSGSSAAKPPPYGFKPSAPVGPPTNVKPVGNAPPGAPYPIHPPPYTPHNPGIPPSAYNPAHNPAGYGPPPAYNPSYNPAGYGHAPAYNPGYGHASYPQQQYQGSYGAQHPGGVTNININNINTHNNHHYGGGGYSGGFGSYGTGFGYHSYPTYHYSNGDTGSGTLGFFLGYSLAKLTTPTFHSHSSFYNGYTPRYDHYEVHHYYHNRKSVPAQSTIQPNTIVGCVGDSGTICPTGTTSLCTSNGAILCVASATTTVPCADQKQGNCVKTTIPCVNGTGNCEIGTNKTVTIPCISSARVPGNIIYANNTIIVNQVTIINNNFNGTTNATVAASNSSTPMSSSSVHNGTIPQINIADSALAALSNITSSTTDFPTTLLPNIPTDGTIAASNSSTLMSSSYVHNVTIPQISLADSVLAALSNITGNNTSSTTDVPTTLMPNIPADGTIAASNSSTLISSSYVHNETMLQISLDDSVLAESGNITSSTTDFSTTLLKNIPTDGTIAASNSPTLTSSSYVHNETIPQINLADSALAALRNITGNITSSTSDVPTTLLPSIPVDGTIAASNSSTLITSSYVHNQTIPQINLADSALAALSNITGNITSLTPDVSTTLLPSIPIDGTIAVSNSSTLMSSSFVYNGTIPPTNLTDSNLEALSDVAGNITSSTTDVPTTLLPNIPADGTRMRRDTPAEPINEFCVTILALPAERKPTEQEIVFSKGTSIFSKFLVKALGAN